MTSLYRSSAILVSIPIPPKCCWFRVCAGEAVLCAQQPLFNQELPRALVVPGRRRFFGLLGREEDKVIPWGAVKRFGEDIILVECL